MLFIICLIIGIVFGLLNKTSSKINGEKIPHYGLFNKEEYNSSLEYTVSVRSLILALIFCQTIFVPVYIAGWNLYTPTKRKYHV